MNSKILIYAKKMIEQTDDSIEALVINSHLHIETKSGRIYKLSDDEIIALATEYLENEIESLKHI